MTEDMKDWLAASSDPQRLTDLESAVWARVEAMRARSAERRARLLALAVALTIGVTNGGFILSTAPSPPEVKAFSLSANLGPLGALDAAG